MPYQPIQQPQLYRGIPVPGGVQGSRDCGPRSWQMLADARTRGRIRPGVRALRRRAGATGPQATSITDAWRALDHLPVPGRTPLRYYRKRRVVDVQRAAAAGKPVHLAIHYGTWNDRMNGRTGDPRFRGAHSVAVVAERDIGHGIEWLLADPLEDGRRAGIARGPSWVLRKDLIAAAVALAGGKRDGIWAGVVGGAHARR